MCNNLWTTPMRAMEAAPDTLWSILTGQARGPSLEPGDAILLAESAEFSMPIESPVPGLVLRSANTRAPAVFTKTVRLTQAGQKLERVKIVPGAEPAAVEISAPNCEVAWCEVTGFAARGIVVQKGGTNAHIHHNWVHGQAPLVGAAVAGIIAGTGRGTTADSMKALIELNLIERLRAFQAIEFKSSDNTAQLNTVLDGGEIVVRHGSRNRTIANWVENGLIGLCGDDPVSMFDRVFGRTPNRGPSGIAIRAGTIPPGPPQASEYVPARRAIIIETDSDIIDGWIKGDGWTVAPVDSRSRRFRGRIERGGRPGGVRVDDDASDARRIVPRKLTPAMVGPNGRDDGSSAEPTTPTQPLPGPLPTDPGEPLPPATIAQIATALEAARAASGDLDDKIRAIREAPSSEGRKQAEDVALEGLVAMRKAVRQAARQLRALEQGEDDAG
jgi:hypothetical protein